jgi:TolB-like protein/Flp pilus assembly protein TadD
MAANYIIGPFRLDTQAGILFRGAEPVALGQRAVALLQVFVERPGIPVSKDALIEAAWADLSVEESNLTVQIAALRRVFGEEPGGEHWIETLPRRGYRFVGPASVRDQGTIATASPVPNFPMASGAPRLALPDRPSIAVLPFQNMSGDPEQEYFADGMVEDIITALSRFKQLFVIARNSSFTYKGKAVDVKQVARELGVRYVLEGGVRKLGSRMRITGQLVEATTGHQLWANKFDGDVEETFELQDKVTESIIGALEPSVTAAEIARATTKPTDSLDAYELYLRALPHFYQQTREGFGEAQKFLSRAIETDPSYALAKALSALGFSMLTNAGWARDTETQEAIRLAREALAANRDDPETLRMAGLTLAYLTREHDIALVALDRAVALNPSSAQVMASSGWVRSYIGDSHTAMDHFKRAIRFSPLDPQMSFFLTGLAMCCLMTGDDAEALTYGRRAANQPTWLASAPRAQTALVATGQLDEARDVVRNMLRVSPAATVSYLRKMFPYRDMAFRDKYLGALRAAGLPE